eukprot:2137701-Lingulodinium_polyedra.AAC.1
MARPPAETSSWKTQSVAHKSSLPAWTWRHWRSVMPGRPQGHSRARSGGGPSGSSRARLHVSQGGPAMR